MFSELFNSPAATAISIVPVVCLNHVLVAIGLRYEAGQQLMTREGADSRAAVNMRGRLVAQLGLTAAIVGVSFLVDPVVREALAGGYLVMQIAAVAMNVDGTLRMRALLRPGIGDGQVRFSPEFQYRASAARLAGVALFAGVVALFFWNVAFGVGCVFLCAGAIGMYRRARRTSGRAAAV